RLINTRKALLIVAAAAGCGIGSLPAEQPLPWERQIPPREAAKSVAFIETEAWLLARHQHDSEASFVSHHPSVSFGSICKRNGFDHRTDLLQGAKGNRVRSREPPRFEQEETEGTEIGTKISSLFSLFAHVQSAPATISWPRGA